MAGPIFGKYNSNLETELNVDLMCRNLIKNGILFW